ncbi:DUF3892 domain-containing protein [Pseudoalteromonas piscicida]|uniref:DUF3892 domain-containing protein n=1 Tax=Pseudoalteromonas piscicida TaxID=43662 RepID=A0AAD0RGI4_PSEO7|nr:DUF3892 domain-containing protein [Pseudoalteromonas piscicida]ASD67028.1 hypothetical protein B1L02_08325 [Pseudoalteromonas piscicida]AXR02265.1 DUF3892 domain-containing protein [Pseudoalteromonas piscicida]
MPKKTKLKVIKGNNDGKNGANATYQVGKNKSVKKSVLIKQVEMGKHPNHQVVRPAKSANYVRSKADGRKANNVNR